MSFFNRAFAKFAYVVGDTANNINPKRLLYKPDFHPDSPLGENEISVKWFGTAAYRIEYGGTVLWIDPYFSRHRFLELRSKPLEPKTSEIDRYMDRADYIVIGHSHYDHAADLSHIVPKTGATVFGSASTGNLFDLFKMPKDRFTEVTGGDTVEAGPIKVTFVRSVHGKLMGRIPFNFDISLRSNAPLTAQEYGCGEVFTPIIEVGGYRIYHQGSGGIVDDTLRGLRADLALIGVSSRKATPKMVYRVVKELQPKVVMPMHYDQFFWPIDWGMMLIPGINFRQVLTQSLEAAPDAEVITLPLCGEYRIGSR